MLKSCSAGCLSMIGAFLLFCGFFQLAGDGASLMLLLFFIVSGGIPLWLAWSMVQSARADAARGRELKQEWQERQVLRIAAANNGRVTPSLVAMNTPDIGLAEARTLLHQLAVEGFCTCDSDAQGTVYYDFDLGERQPQRRMSADDWVEMMSQRRMTGSQGDVFEQIDE